MTASEIISKLKAFDLKITDTKDIRALLEQFGNIMLLGIEIPVGDFLIRGVPDDNYEIGRHFENKISYISDSKIPIRENRGTVEGRPGFYALTSRGDENFSQVVCIQECGTIFSKPENDNIIYEEYVTMGKWRVIKPITVLAVVHKKDFIEHNSELGELHQSFLKKCHDFPERQEDLIAIAEFLADEFSKPVGSGERYKYKITNQFCEIFYERGGMGVVYPSVKSEGKRFNIVLTKETVDNCLKLEKIVVWNVKKKNTQCVPVPHLFCDTFTEDGKFNYMEVPPDYPEHIIEQMLSGQHPDK